MKIQILKSSLLAGIALAFSACAGRQVTRPVTTLDPQTCVATTNLLTQKIKRGKTTTLGSELVTQRTDSICTAHQTATAITQANLQEIVARREVSAKIIANSLAGNLITPAMRAELIKQALLNLQSGDSTTVQAQSAALTEKGLSIPQLRAEHARNARAVSCVSVKNNETGGVTITCSKPHAAPAKPGAPEPQ
jgi:hypothetical protein